MLVPYNLDTRVYRFPRLTLALCATLIVAFFVQAAVETNTRRGGDELIDRAWDEQGGRRRL